MSGIDDLAKAMAGLLIAADEKIRADERTKVLTEVMPILRAAVAFRNGPADSTVASVMFDAVDTLSPSTRAFVEADGQWRGDEERAVDRQEAAVRDLVFCLHIYPSYRVDSRGPRGCILDAIGALAPKMRRELCEDGADVVFERHFADDENL